MRQCRIRWPGDMELIVPDFVSSQNLFQETTARTVSTHSLPDLLGKLVVVSMAGES
jgi:hypothetical protein